MIEQQAQMSIDSATCALAATIVGRAHELMQEGYSKKALNEGARGVQKFCVHGAMNMAFIEMFPDRKEQCGRLFVCGGYAASEAGYGPIEAVATAILVDEAVQRFSYDPSAWKAGMMGVAPLNDDPHRTQDDVLGILEGAERRLWDMSLEPVGVDVEWDQEDQVFQVMNMAA